MSHRETEIMLLIETGMTQREVAAELGINVSYVASVVRLYDFRTVLGSSTRFEDMVRIGSQALERAVLATGKRYA